MQQWPASSEIRRLKHSPSFGAFKGLWHSLTAFQKITLTGIEVLVMCCVVALSCQIVSKAPHYWQPAFRQQIACRTHAVFGPQCVAILACRNAAHAKPPDQSCPSLVFDHQASLLFAPCLHGLLVLSPKILDYVTVCPNPVTQSYQWLSMVHEDKFALVLRFYAILRFINIA